MIQNLIISDESGIPLFARSLMCNIGMRCVNLARDGSLDDDSLLKSALFTAKITFDEADKGEFHEFEMEKSHVLSYSLDNINAMFALQPPADLEKYSNRLRLIAELFKKNYSDEVKNYSGDIEPFEKFQEIIVKNGLLEEGERFRANCINCEWDKACPFRVFTGPKDLTLKERLEAISPLGWFKRIWLMLKGMFVPLYLT